jgi:hypothetical protein
MSSVTNAGTLVTATPKVPVYQQMASCPGSSPGGDNVVSESPALKTGQLTPDRSALSQRVQGRD